MYKDMDKINFKNGEEPYISAPNLKKLQENAEKAIKGRTPTLELLTVSDTAPTTCKTGDKYYNTSTNKIYTATAENTWGTTGEDPTNLDIYVDLEHTKLYYYDGTNFKSYGGGSGTKEVGYTDEELEGTEKILIETSDFDGVEPLGVVEITSGTWKPQIACLNGESAPTVTYSWQTGKYVKIGKLIFVEFGIRGKITALNGTNNYASIIGLPEQSKIYSINSNGAPAITLGNVYAAFESEVNLASFATKAGIRLQNNYGSSAAKWKITNNDNNYFEVYGSGIYTLEEE